MRVAACHPSKVEEVSAALAKAQALGAQVVRGEFMAVDGWCIKGADRIEDVVGDETLASNVVEVREVVA